MPQGRRRNRVGMADRGPADLVTADGAAPTECLMAAGGGAGGDGDAGADIDADVGGLPW